MISEASVSRLPRFVSGNPSISYIGELEKPLRRILGFAYTL
jgi:hypothetical protein